MRPALRGRRAVLAGLVLSLTLAQGALAAVKGERRLDDLQSLLDRGQWKAAAEKAEKVREDFVARIEEAEAVLPLAAQTLVLQAIAEANLGRDDRALWHWHAAQTWLPGLPEMDLSAYGRAREVLAGRSVEEVPPAEPSPPAEADGRKRSRTREVKIESAVEPVYPKSLRKTGQEGAVVVKIIVGTDGRPRQPVVREAGLVPTMAFPALEALQAWRFAPAQRDGRPVPVYYELKIRYR